MNLKTWQCNLRNLITLCQSLPEIENEIKNNYATGLNPIST
jgi:hypothetical protein